MLLVRDPDPGKLAGAQQPRHCHCIPAVGLHPIARPAWHRRGRDDQTFRPELAELPIQAEPERARLVAEAQLDPWASQAGDQPAHRLGRAGNGAVEANLPVRAILGHRHSDRLLVHVQADELDPAFHAILPSLLGAAFSAAAPRGVGLIGP